MAKNDAFGSGVAPGGLRTQNEVRILLCYLLNSIDAPISAADLQKVIAQHQLANYFEVMDALSLLQKNGHLQTDANGDYLICDSGREIARQLDVDLPLSVRDNALQAAMRLMSRARNAREHLVELLPTDRGYLVTCHVSDGKNDMMTLSLTVPDAMQAKLVENTFYDDPERVYATLLTVLTGTDMDPSGK